jgi:hypothetical protein
MAKGAFEREEYSVVDIYWLIGAVIGSGLFIFLGGQPARRLVTAVRVRARTEDRGRR